METVEQKSFLESDIYVNPKQAFDEVITRLSADNSEIKTYLDGLLASENPKDNSHQEAIRPILEALLQKGEKESAGLLFNIHRVLTQFQGYGTNEDASSDVDACFKEETGMPKEIPERGVIVVDFFVTRNLPRIIEICENRGIDLSRIRVCVPQGVLAAQLMGMNESKKQEFETACAKLKEDQFIVRDVNHNAEFGGTENEDIAIWFSPRTMPITPALHENTEAETIQSFCDWFRAQVAKVVQGGRIYANLAYDDEAPWKPLEVETTKAKRTLTKLTGISRTIAIAIVDALIDQGFAQQPMPDEQNQNEFKPSERNPKVDHGKLAKELHLVRR